MDPWLNMGQEEDSRLSVAMLRWHGAPGNRNNEEPGTSVARDAGVSNSKKIHHSNTSDAPLHILSAYL